MAGVEGETFIEQVVELEGASTNLKAHSPQTLQVAEAKLSSIVEARDLN